MKFLSWFRKHIIMRKLLLLLLDMLITSALLIGTMLVFAPEFCASHAAVLIRFLIAFALLRALIFYVFRFYSVVFRFFGANEMLPIFLGAAADVAAECVILRFTPYAPLVKYYLVVLFGNIALLCLSRLIGRRLASADQRWEAHQSDKRTKRVMVVGAGAMGMIIINEMQTNYSLFSKPVVLVDDSPSKQNFIINGVVVKGTRDDIPTLYKKYDIDEIVIALPSASKTAVDKIAKICSTVTNHIKIMPSLSEMDQKGASVRQARNVDIADLLGRDEVIIEKGEIYGYVSNKTVLITGGGGSIGSEICRQIARFSPKKIVVFDVYENTAYDLQNEMRRKYGDSLDFDVIIGSMCDRDTVDYVFRTIQPDIVFHAAAHKHVPLMEGNPMEAFRNNVYGTLNTVEAANEHGVKRFVLISTDKAVNPTNVMGATKRVTEMIIQAMTGNSKTEYVAVRFGNVLGSNGSVIPLFKKQIEAGGPVTVTDKRTIRFFMTIPEAAQLVIQAGAMAQGGEIFILDMGAPVKIDDLARNLIQLSGYTPDQDIKIVYTGLRPGEKLYEELLLGEEGLTATKHEKIFIAKPADIGMEFIAKLKEMKETLSYENSNILEILEGIIGKRISPDEYNSKLESEEDSEG